MENKEILRELLKVNVHSDLSEMAICDINPIANIQNVEVQNRLIILQGNCKRLRVVFDGINNDFAIALGDLADNIKDRVSVIVNEEIEKALN